MSADGGLWYVKLADGDVEPMSLDDLDEAFNSDRVDENTMVLPAGELQWQRLGTLLGLDAEPPRPAAPAATPVSWAPAPMPASLRPVSVDLGADLDLDLDGPSPFKRRSRKPLFGGIAAALVIGVVAFAATRGGGSASVAAATAPAAPPPVVAAAPPPAPPPPPVASPPPPDTRFSADQKAKLAAADKALADKAASRKKAKGAAATHGQPKYKSQGFTTGGSKFDPLNAAP